MTDKIEKTADPVMLGANSFNLQDLEKASHDAHSETDPEKRAARIAALPTDAALDQASIAGANAPACPEGHELRQVDMPDGSTKLIPVDVTHEQSVEAGSTDRAKSRRKPGADTGEA